MIFTCLSSVQDDASFSTKRGNAALHDMRSVTVGAIAYVATQVANYTLTILDVSDE